MKIRGQARGSEKDVMERVKGKLHQRGIELRVDPSMEAPQVDVFFYDTPARLVVDYVLKQMTGENVAIDFSRIDVSKIFANVITNFWLPEVQVPNPCIRQYCELPFFRTVWCPPP